MIARFGIAVTAALLIASPAWSQAAPSKDCPPSQAATTGAGVGANNSKDTIRDEQRRKEQSAILPSAEAHPDSKAPTIPDQKSVSANDCGPEDSKK